VAELKNAAELEAASQESPVDFLQTDLALCFTFADLTKTELALGDRDAAERVFSKAQQGHATIERFLTGVQDVAQRREIGQKLTDLRLRLDAFKTDDGTFHKDI
jgi:hypothetical protein